MSKLADGVAHPRGDRSTRSKEDLLRALSALRSCASIQHGRHIDTMPIESPLSRNEQPLVAISERPSHREIYEYEKEIRIQAFA